jgi:hypothetical protein
MPNTTDSHFTPNDPSETDLVPATADTETAFLAMLDRWAGMYLYRAKDTARIALAEALEAKGLVTIDRTTDPSLLYVALVTPRKPVPVTTRDRGPRQGYALGDPVTYNGWAGRITEIDEHDPTHIEVTYLCERAEWMSDYHVKPVRTPAAENPALEELRSLDIESLIPIDALTMLRALKRLAGV